MKYHCTPATDLDELIGHDELDGFHQGPIYTAIKRNEPLELEDSAAMSPTVCAKVARLGEALLVPETGECLKMPSGFRIDFH